ncbi:ATP-binding protein [Parasulfuritortus cantonensis]|uniref:ATP-binding protein n=1 Tax=Parasulfuritortus cantonensis TaxID=2528202 RepID=UPI0014044A30|nr:ATP-binding protein [Parasulfuritortus cantonensis]
MPADQDPSERLVLANDHAGLADLGSWLEAFAERWALPPAAAFRLDLVLTEAVTNVMDHARAPGRPGHIELTCRLDDGEIRVTLADDGPAFDPTAHVPAAVPGSLAEAEPGGLGIRLMRQYSSRFEYRREADRNVLHLALPVDSAAPGRP